MTRIPIESLDDVGIAGPFALRSVTPGHLEALYQAYTTPGAGNPRDAHLHDGLVQALLQDPAILEAVAAAGIPEGVIWRSSMFFKAPGAAAAEIKWHHDTHFDRGDQDIDFAHRDQLSVLVALRDVDDRSGVFQYIPGSHADVEIHQSQPDGARPRHLKELGQHFPDLPPDVSRRAASMPLAKGEFAIFHSGLFHCSLPVPDGGLPRLSLAVRFTRPPELLDVPTVYHPLLALPFRPGGVAALPVIASRRGTGGRPESGRSLAGRRIIVTGGAGEFGTALAAHLLRAGARVDLLGRSASGLAGAVQRLLGTTISPASGQLRTHAVDVLDRGALRASLAGDGSRDPYYSVVHAADVRTADGLSPGFLGAVNLWHALQGCLVPRALFCTVSSAAALAPQAARGTGYELGKVWSMQFVDRLARQAANQREAPSACVYIPGGFRSAMNPASSASANPAAASLAGLLGLHVDCEGYSVRSAINGRCFYYAPGIQPERRPRDGQSAFGLTCADVTRMF